MIDVLAAVPTPEPDQWALRIPLTLAIVAAAVAIGWLMRRGWRRRTAADETLPPLPQPPVTPAESLLPPLDGVYVGSTTAGQWLDRITSRGLGRRGNARLTLTPDGIVIDRVGEAPLLLPAAQVHGARLESRLAGKVMGPGGLLVLSWSHGDRLLDTGFRADDHASHPTWVRAITHLTTAEKELQ